MFQISFLKKQFIFPLKKQFLFIISFLFLCIGLITSFTCKEYIRLHTTVVRQNMDLYSSQLSRSVGDMYQICRNIANTLAYNQILQNYLTAEVPSDKYNHYNPAYNQLTSMMELSPYIRDIAAINNNGNFIAVYGSKQTYTDQEDSISLLCHSLHSLGMAEIQNSNCQILGMPVFQLKENAPKQIGTLFLAVDISMFFQERPVMDIGYVPEYLLIDQNKNILYGEQAYYDSIASNPETAEVQINSHTYYVSQYSLPLADTSFYMFIDKDIFSSAGKRIGILQLRSMGILLLIVSIVMFQIYRPLIKSLQKLTSFMMDITGDNQNYKTGIVLRQGLIGSTEIKEITDAFNAMLLHTYELNHTIFENYTHMYEMDLNNKETEIAYLRSQINPHFLYNTLTMICGMASANLQKEIIDTAGALSSIFRYSIKGEAMVSLREEMEIVQSYIKIQTYRFGNRFTVTYELPEEFHKCLIPKMVIQPLVENAIVHGLEPSLKPGTLLIGAGRNPEKGYLAIWIYDTGVGMKPEKLAQLQKTLQKPVHSSDTIMDSYNTMDIQHHDSIGLLNVNSRMVLSFGNEYHLLLDSEEGIGTNIQLRIPYRTKD